MAILIPSKNIYDKQNPKVRDNVIERMEVSAVEIVPDNKYETIVFTKEIELNFNGEWQTDVDIYGNAMAMSDTYYQRGVFVGIKTYNIKQYEIKIPKIENNKYISKIYNKTNKDEENYIKTSLRYKKYNGTRNVTLLHEKAPNINTSTIIGDILPATQNNLIITYGDIIYEDIPIEEKTVDLIADNLTVEKEISAVGFENKQLVAKVDGIDETNLSIVDIDETDEKFYKLNISILIGYEKYYGYQMDELNPSDEILIPAKIYLNQPHNITLNAEKVIAEKLEITFYGNTIGIDLQDKTIYIPNTDTTSKKVFSVDGNELMQANYRTIAIKGVVLDNIEDYKVTLVSSPGEEVLPTSRAIGNRTQVTFLTDRAINSDKTITYNDSETITIYRGATSFTFSSLVTINKIETHDTTETILDVAQDFARVQKSYSKGKETATIRCSISDYYDYQNGEKVIAIDNSTSKMSFKMYDQVIPMVYSANGQDKPMSLYQDGSPKVFQVLGTKIYYDGAVWQELSLQEV